MSYDESKSRTGFPYCWKYRKVSDLWDKWTIKCQHKDNNNRTKKMAIIFQWTKSHHIHRKYHRSTSVSWFRQDIDFPRIQHKTRLHNPDHKLHIQLHLTPRPIHSTPFIPWILKKHFRLLILANHWHQSRLKLLFSSCFIIYNRQQVLSTRGFDGIH